MTEAARLVDELTTLLYEVTTGWDDSAGGHQVVRCGACRRRADRAESVVHESDCPVYRLIRSEEANTAVIRANAEEIADLEDVRDGLEAQVNAMTAENERGQQAFADLTLASVERINALEAERDEWKRINQSDNQCAARRLEQAESERDALAARLAASEAALTPCSLAREYRDGVTCRDYRDSRGVCMNHRVIEGLRVHAVTADRLEIENRALRRQVRATYGIIHEGLHGGKATDPEHQEACERPACRNARAALAGSRKQAQGEGA